MHRLHLFRRQLVIAPHHHLSAQLAHVLHQVVGKRVVVVQHEHHGLIVFPAISRRFPGDLPSRKASVGRERGGGSGGVVVGVGDGGADLVDVGAVDADDLVQRGKE